MMLPWLYTKSIWFHFGRVQGRPSKRRKLGGGLVSNRAVEFDGEVEQGKLSDVFEGIGIYVTSRNMQTWGSNMIRVVIENGGEDHRNLIRDQTHYVLTDENRGLHYQNIVKDDRVDIVTELWLIESVRAGRLLEFSENEKFYFHLF